MNYKPNVFAVLFMMTCLLSQTVARAEQVLGRNKSDQYNKMDRQRKLAVRVAPITSVQSLARYMSMKPAKKNPIKLLSIGGQKRFTDSLTFNENGLTGFSYADLNIELTPDQIISVLKLFGSQDSKGFLKQSSTKVIIPGNNLVIGPDTGCSDEDWDCDSGGGGGGGGIGGGGEVGGGGEIGGGDNGSGFGGGSCPPGYVCPPVPPIIAYPNGDYGNRQCHSRGTCEPRENNICKSSC